MKKFDKILIGVFVVMAIVVGIFMKIRASRDYNEKYAEIKIEGNLYKRVKLEPNKPVERINIKTDLGENVIEIKDGGVSIIEADCPDQVCVKDGHKEHPGDVIVCLPNKVIIEIKGEVNDSNVDIISQ